MHDLFQTLRAFPVEFDPQAPEPTATASLSDSQLVGAAAQAVSRPKTSRSTSFTLHAPLELIARAALLPWVPPHARPVARRRIANIASAYAEGDEIDPPRRRFADVDAAKAALIAALREHDPDTADAAVVALAPHFSPRAFGRLLTDEIAANLNAAAHAPLLLAALPEATARHGDLAMLLRSPIRALAKGPAARLTWVEDPGEPRGPASLWDALADPPRVRAANDFIIPTMLAVEADGLAARILGRATRTTVEAAVRDLSRIAALAMLQDDPDRAPYGWTHCLTLPQGLLALAPYSTDPDRLVRIAATYSLGFRSTLGRTALDPGGRPAASPDPSVLAARAAAHEDAHLVKYTVACFAAAAADPPARSLFLAAAAYLGDWWDQHPGAGFEG